MYMFLGKPLRAIIKNLIRLGFIVSIFDGRQSIEVIITLQKNDEEQLL